MNEKKSNKRTVVRSKCGTLDYVMEGAETICTLRVPLAVSEEYDKNLAQIIAVPELARLLFSSKPGAAASILALAYVAVDALNETGGEN